jgi:hypothetical protein
LLRLHAFSTVTNGGEMHNNRELETDKEERAKKLKELLVEFNNVEAKLRLLEQYMTEIRNGMSVLVLNIRSKGNGDHKH